MRRHTRIQQRAVWSLLSVALACGLAQPALAQRPDSAQARDTIPGDSAAFHLEPLIINAERERAAPPPVIATVLDPGVVRSSLESDPYRILRQLTGIEVHDQGQGPGFASNVTMRGFTSDHSSDVLLVIDGVPVNLPSHGHVEGYADWNVLMPSSVSSMRVIHGGASPLYGDFALAGVVEVFTRSSADGFTGSYGATSFGDVSLDLSTGTTQQSSGTFVGTDFRRDNGWRDHSAYWVSNTLARGWRTAGQGRVEGGLSVYATDWDSPGFLTVPQFNGPNPERSGDPTDGGSSRRAVAHGRYVTPLGSATLQATAWGLWSDYEIFLNLPGHTHDGSVAILTQSGEWDNRWGAGGQVEVGWPGRTGDLVIGVQSRADWVDYQHAPTFDRTPLNEETDLTARHRSASLYARWRRQVSDRLSLDVGARVDHLRHQSTSNLEADSETERSSNTIASPKVGARLGITRSLSFRAASSRGFRSPTGIIGFPDRKPYVAWSHEAGFDYQNDRLSGSVSYFRVSVSNERIQDPISLEVSDEGSSVRQGVTAHGAVHLTPSMGLEFRGTYNHALLSGAYVDAHDDGDVSPPAGAADNDDLRRVPGVARLTGQARFTFAPSTSWNAWTGLRSVGSHVPIGEPTIETQSYSVVDVGIGWSFGEGREIHGEILNVADQRYVELRSAGYVVPGTPRSLRVKLSFFPG